MPSSSGNRLHYVVLALWLTFTLSLVSWWIAVGMRFGALQRMYVWEGGTLIALLVGGGVAMVLAIRREHRRRAALETFFLSFTHDVKTSLASLQLQAEGLREDWPPSLPPSTLDHLLHETVRLQIQLENSLFVAQPDGRLLAEHVDVARAVQRVAQDWPALRARVAQDATVQADARAFDVVLRNLFQNAVIHGAATDIVVTASHATEGLVRLRMVDNGRGVPRERYATLGQPFDQSADSNGTGVGLFVCDRLVRRMNGVLRFPLQAQRLEGFAVEIDLPRAT